MSFLALKAGVPDFNKAVISLWFRIPRESVLAAAGRLLATQVPGFSIMQSILPLITFGKPQTNKNYQSRSRDVAHWMTAGISAPWIETYYTDETDYDVDPCYIGALCLSNGNFYVAFNIQTGSSTSLASTTWITTRMDLWSGIDPSAPTDYNTPGSGTISQGFMIGRAHIQEASYVDEAQPDFFYVETAEVFEPDKWHHVLLSFDVSGAVAIGHPFPSSDCRLWYAIDDVDYRGVENLQPWRQVGDNLDENAIVTDKADRWSGFDPADQRSYLYQNCWIALPSGTYEAGQSIAAEDEHLGIPAAEKYVEVITRCEMAEFQMWTGVTLDTGVTKNRRRFVDANGKPVSPTTRTKDDPNSLTEIPKTPGEKLFGRQPEILLHGSSNWKRGYNTGTLGVEEDSDGNQTEIPSGQFEPTAKIERYKPDPSLEPTTA